MNISHNILKQIADETKLRYETISESFSLYRRDLLFSNKFSSIFVPIFNDNNISDVIENINLFFYLKEKFNTRLIIAINKNSKYKSIYTTFSNLYDKLYECKRFTDLHFICENERVDRLFYNKSFRMFDDIEYYTENEFILVNDIVLKQNIQEYPNSTNLLSINNIRNFHKYAELLLKNIDSIRLSDISQIDKNNDVVQNLSILINASSYINMASNDILDYLAPFVGIKIIAINTNMYNENIFKLSASYKNNIIQTILK